jgi:signal transduction histidine kinase
MSVYARNCTMNDRLRSFRAKTSHWPECITSYHYLLFLLFVIAGHHSQAVEINIDSLKKELIAPKNDSIELFILQDLYYHYYDTDSTQTYKYVKQIEELTSKTNEKDILASSYSLLADYNGSIGQHIKSKEYYEQAIELNLELRDTVNYSYNIFNLGVSFDFLGDYISALNCYHKSLTIAEKIDDKLGVAEILGNIAILYCNQADYEKSIAFFEKALTINKELKNKEATSMSLGNLGAVYHDYSIEKKDSVMLEKALEYYEQALDIQTELEDLSSIAWIKANIGLLYNDQANYDLALEYMNSSLAISDSINDKSAKATAYGSISEVNFNKKEYHKALANQEKSYKIGKSINDKLIILAAYEGLAKIYEKLNNYKLAYKYHTLYKSSQDSLYNIDKNSQFDELITLYESNKKEQAIKVLQTEQQLNQLEINQQKAEIRLYIVGAISMFLIALILLFFYFQIKQKDNRLEQANARLIESKKELSKLNETKTRFFAIIAHDLRGSLTSFQGIGKVIKNHLQKDRLDRITLVADRIDNSARQLNNLLDNLLNWAVTQIGDFPFYPKKLNLRKEVDHVVDAFDETAKSKNISLAIEIPEDLTVLADQNGLSVVLRNLLSNAFKFTNDGGYVSVSAQEMENKVVVSISDTGIGIAADKINSLFEIDDKKSTAGVSGEKGTGLGLILCKEFVNLHKGEISVDSAVGSGSTFTFSLPMVAVES